MLDKDILVDFQAEAKGLLAELEGVVEGLEDSSDEFPKDLLEQFAQRIDRIMGAAQTLNTMDAGHLGLKRIASLAQVCKRLGYKAAEYKVTALVPLFAAFWADTLETMGQLVDSVDDEEKSRKLAEAFSAVMEKRLNWLGEKVQKMAPAAAGAGGGDLKSQLEIDKLLAGR